MNATVRQTSVLAVVSLVFGILGIVLAVIGFLLARGGKKDDGGTAAPNRCRLISNFIGSILRWKITTVTMNGKRARTAPRSRARR